MRLAAGGSRWPLPITRVEQVIICTPDKDLAQCVTADGRVVQLDRRREITYDRAGVIEKFGVPPESIPDYLGVVGDTADGFPGLQGLGCQIGGSRPHPLRPHRSDSDSTWRSGTSTYAAPASSRLTLRENSRRRAALFRRIATVDIDAPVSKSVDEMAWAGPMEGFDERCAELGAERIAQRAHDLFAKQES